MAKTIRKKTNEGLATAAASAEADHELQMARSQLYKIAQYAIKLHEMMKDVTDPNGIEAWQAAKITKAADYMGAVYHDLDYKIKFEQQGGELGAEPGEIAVGEGKKKYGKMKETSDPYMRKLRSKLSEKAKSKSQQQAAGIALKHKREGTKPEPGTASAEMMSMSKSDLEDYAGTKHKGKPDHVDEKIANEAGRSRDYDSYGTFTGGQDRPGGEPSARDRGIDDDGDQAYLDKKKSREEGTWYLFIDGKLWTSGGKPKAFQGRKEANKVGLAVSKKYPEKKVTLSPNPKAAPQGSTKRAESINNESMPSKLRQKLDNIKSGKLDDELPDLEKKAKKFGNKQIMKAVSDRRASRFENRSSEKYEDWAKKFVKQAQQMPEFKDPYDIANSAGIDADFYETNKKEINRAIKKITGERNIEQFLKTVG